MLIMAEEGIRHVPQGKMGSCNKGCILKCTDKVRQTRLAVATNFQALQSWVMLRLYIWMLFLKF